MPVGNDPTAVTLGELWRNIITDIGGATPVDITTEYAYLNAFDVALSALPGPSGGRLNPTGTVGATLDRKAVTVATLANTTGTMQLTAVYLPINTKVSNFNFLPGGTGDAGPTNQWMGLYSNTRALLAISADGLTTAITANTVTTYAVANVAAGAATSFTTTYSGLYYIGQLIATSNAPVFYGLSTTAADTAVINTIPPILTGTSNTGLTTPQTFPTTATALTPTAGLRLQWLT